MIIASLCALKAEEHRLVLVVQQSSTSPRAAARVSKPDKGSQAQMTHILWPLKCCLSQTYADVKIGTILHPEPECSMRSCPLNLLSFGLGSYLQTYIQV